MANKLDNKTLTDYLHTRLKEVPHHKFNVSLMEDGSEISLELASGLPSGRWSRIVLKPEVVLQNGKPVSVEFDVSPDTIGVSREDFAGFLEKYISDDTIFQKGQPLYSEERHRDLPRLRRILLRTEKPGEPVIACAVIDRDVGADALKSAVYDYMMRPCLSYLFSLRNRSN